MRRKSGVPDAGWPRFPRDVVAGEGETLQPCHFDATCPSRLAMKHIATQLLELSAVAALLGLCRHWAVLSLEFRLPMPLA